MTRKYCHLTHRSFFTYVGGERLISRLRGSTLRTQQSEYCALMKLQSQQPNLNKKCVEEEKDGAERAEGKLYMGEPQKELD